MNMLRLILPAQRHKLKTIIFWSGHTHTNESVNGIFLRILLENILFAFLKKLISFEIHSFYKHEENLV